MRMDTEWLEITRHTALDNSRTAVSYTHLAFYMVDKSRSRSEHGAGLGLALVSRIAKLHDTCLLYTSRCV